MSWWECPFNCLPEPVRFGTFIQSGLICLLIFLLPLAVAAQSTDPRGGENGQEFLAALFETQREQPSRVPALLQANSSVITPRLWQQFTDLAASAYYSEVPENSLLFYEIAKRIAEHLRDPRLLATTYYNVGRTQSALNRITQSIESYLESKKLFEEAGAHRDIIYLLSDLGSLHFILEDYRKAEYYSKQSVNIAARLENAGAPPGAWPDEYGVARALATLAEIHSREGDHDQAVDHLQRSLSLYLQLGKGGSAYDIYIADCHAALGRVYTTAGDYAQALFHIHKALGIAKTLSDPGRVANLLNSLGYLYMEQEDYAQAAEQYKQSYQTYLAQNNKRESARVLLNLGVVEQRRGSYGLALEHFKESLRTAQVSQNKDVMIAAGEGIGVVLGATGNHGGALETLNEGLALSREMNDKTRQAELLWRLAEVRYATGDYRQAAALAEDAVELARALRLPKLTYLATVTLGQAYAGLNEADLAEQTLSLAVEQVEAMRDQVAGQREETQLFFENKVAPFHALAALLLNRGRPLDALLIAERAKGRVLLDVLRGGRVDLSKVMTPAEREESRRLNRDIFDLSERARLKQAQAGPEDPETQQLYARLDAARLKYQSFLDALHASKPGMNIRRGMTPALTRDGIDRLTRGGPTAYLEYVFTKDRVHLFVLTSKSSEGGSDLRSYPLAVGPNDLRQKVERFRRMLADRQPAFAGAARELYDLLIKPAAPQLRSARTLCVIPDGPLWEVPFQGLLSAGDHYLIEDYALHYAPSLSVLLEMARPKELAVRQTGSSLIAFGSPEAGAPGTTDFRAGGGGLGPLPEAVAEVTALAKITRGKALVGREASEKNFKSLAPSYRTIHVATHGVLDDRQPLYSHLLLAKAEGGAEDDGLLEAREVMDMSLSADLAILSACETARGRVGAGEGVIGMSWAFFVAGVRTTVVSQWRVSSAGTSRLMVNFHQALKSNSDRRAGAKADAVRAAALELMKDQRYRHPFYWAGFVVVGSNE